MTATALTSSPPPAVLPGPPLPAVFAGGPKAEQRFWEFFATQLANDNTRRAYFNAARRFAEWCELRELAGLHQVKPIHISAYLKALQGKLSAPTVKQHLAALRMLFDWLVIGHVLDVNPAHAVRGPKHSVKKGKTPVLDASEARALLDSIAITRTVTRDDGTKAEEPLLVGLRDRALIGVMVYTFARVGAALSMRVEDYYIQGRRGWVRLHEKGGKLHTLPCHHNLDRYLEEYIAAAGIAGDAKGPLFRTVRSRAGLELTASALWQQDAYRMIQRRAKAAGIKTQIGNHTFRATGITAYLKNGGLLETAQHMAGHESPRTTGLYDRRSDDVSLDEVERIGI
jgi:site-specific recombinase XerD